MLNISPSHVYFHLLNTYIHYSIPYHTTHMSLSYHCFNISPSIISYNGRYPLPPLQEQKRIVQKLEQVHRIVREILREKKQMEEKTELLEKSVLDRAFRGEL
ncbi:MAG: hypothetical protein NZ853_08775 [Leptospiraceae bacterium]|nr:hypothetical protein [Leptospiraceae bacterium]MDW7976731.1 hypothetical protein [Leptospiraceae bacterium]